MSEQPSLKRLILEWYTYKLVQSFQERGFTNSFKTERMNVVAPETVEEKLEVKVRDSIGEKSKVNTRCDVTFLGSSTSLLNLLVTLNAQRSSWTSWERQ